MAIAVRPQRNPIHAPSEQGARVTSVDVWRELERASFAVLGYATPSGDTRSNGVVFKASGGRLYTAVAPGSWKARHIAATRKVSVTVPVRRGGLLTLAMPIPPATISFHGRAIVHAPGTLDLATISEDLVALLPAERRTEAAVIEIIPEGEFLTYGLGTPLLDMAKPDLARAVVPVLDETGEIGRPATSASFYGLMALALCLAIAGIWLLPASIAAVMVAIVAVVLVARGSIAHRRARIALFGLVGFIALTAIPGGAGLAGGTMGVPASWLAGSPFSDYMVPGLALLGLCGGMASAGWLTAFVERPWALAISAMAGTFMAVYEVVEIVTIDGTVAPADLPLALGMQVVWLIAGVAVAALAIYVFRAERPSRLTA